MSAYCGGLWLAALEAAIAIGKILIEHPREVPYYPPKGFHSEVNKNSVDAINNQVSVYQSWLEKALPIYQEKLWNGKYYRLDSESNSEVVMADQLCGQFYAKLLNLADIVPV